jgi:hypothetical protein
VEEHEVAHFEDDALEGGRDAVEDILARRGYLKESPHADEDEEEGMDESQGAADEAQSGAIEEEPGNEVTEVANTEEAAAATSNEEAQEEVKSNEEAANVPLKKEDVKAPEKVTPELPTASLPDETDNEQRNGGMEDVMLEKEGIAKDEELKEPNDMSDPMKTADPEPAAKPTETKAQPEASVKAHPISGKSAAAPNPTPHASPALESEYKKALSDAREAQKECRTLRRHVVSLNAELEACEAEIQAQRTELERAADRMEKDRIRQKEEKERLVTRHAEELKGLKSQHDQTIAEIKKRSEQQVEEARVRMKEIEQRRMQEGGDWNKEMENALHREQEAVRRMANLEDEKSTLLSQISTLQAQQAALEIRLESVSQTADNAMEREREAEDRLDAALSMHARQLTQRQARESELERTVADLGAALVVARNKEVNRLKSDPNGSTAGERGGNDISALRSRLEDTEDHLETVKAQLELERQRSITLQQELQEVSKERTEESSAAHARQLQSDRKIADMSVTISRLQATIRDSRQASFGDSKDSVYSSDHGERSARINSLSEQVLKQQETIARSKSEILALKNRLKVAVARADKAEESLSSLQDSDDLYDRMEAAPLSASSRTTMRNRNGRASSASIRSAINMNPGQGDKREKIGNAIDAVDSFSVQTGKYLRSNPLARAGFLLYLFLIHLWTFALFIFHAHGFETVHGDFGGGVGVPHGPHALMQAQNIVAVNP